MNKHIHIINAHQHYPGISEGDLTRTLTQVTKKFSEDKDLHWTETVIEQGYSAETEIQHYLKADYIVVHMPVYWFNTPWLHKKYVDEVFTAGIAPDKLVRDDGRSRQDPSKQYGTGGLVQNKKMTLVATWNAPEAFSGDKDQYLLQGKTADDVLFNISLNYRFSGFEVLPCFHCFDVMKAPQVDSYIADYKQHLNRLVQ